MRDPIRKPVPPPNRIVREGCSEPEPPVTLTGSEGVPPAGASLMHRVANLEGYRLDHQDWLRSLASTSAQRIDVQGLLALVLLLGASVVVVGLRYVRPLQSQVRALEAQNAALLKRLDHGPLQCTCPWCPPPPAEPASIEERVEVGR